MLTAVIMLRNLEAGLAIAAAHADHRLVVAHDGPSAAIHDLPLPGPRRRGKRRRGAPPAPEQRPPGRRRHQPSRLALIDLGDDPIPAMAAVAKAYDLQRLHYIGLQSDHDHAQWAQLLSHHCGSGHDQQRVVCATTDDLLNILKDCPLERALPRRAAPIGDRPGLEIDLSAATARAHRHLLPFINAYRQAQDVGAAAASIAAGHPATISSEGLPADRRQRARVMQALATAASRALHQGRPGHIRLWATAANDGADMLRALLRVQRQPTWRACGRCEDGSLWGHVLGSEAPLLISHQRPK